jgi:hypothetical protein
MSKILMGPTGSIIQGHVLDVSVKPFVQALRDHDPLLYVKWNPKKVRSWGCWEIRRKPEFTTIRDVAEFDGNTILDIGYVENNLLNHVLDCAFLNYDQIRKIKAIDTWQVGPKQWLQNREYMIQKKQEIARDKAKQAVKDAAKTFKREIRAFKEYVNSGNNPHLIAAHWDSTKEAE